MSATATKRKPAAKRPAGRQVTVLTGAERKDIATLDQRLEALRAQRAKFVEDDQRLAELQRRWFEEGDEEALAEAARLGAMEKAGIAASVRQGAGKLIEAAEAKVRLEAVPVLLGIAGRALEESKKRREKMLEGHRQEAAILGATHVEPAGLKFHFDTQARVLQEFIDRPDPGQGGTLRKFCEGRLCADWGE